MLRSGLDINLLTHVSSNQLQRYSPADMWENCAIDDTSIKFGTLTEHSTRKICGYRDIRNFSQGQNGGHFKNGRFRILRNIGSMSI